jgi:hypothetical protein
MSPKYVKAMKPELSQKKKDDPKVGRNDPCPCGSGKKYKKCCGKCNRLPVREIPDLPIFFLSCKSKSLISNKRNKARVSVYFTYRNLLEGPDSGKYFHLQELISPESGTVDYFLIVGKSFRPYIADFNQK